MGAEVVSGFADAHKQAIASGFPDTIDTYGLISGLWTSGTAKQPLVSFCPFNTCIFKTVFALGAFIGPTVAGILFDAIGFPWGALFVVATQVVVVILMLVFLITIPIR